MSVAMRLFTAANTKGVMLASAESCTGGMVSVAITDIPGSSAIFDRAFVTYTNNAKMQMLGVQAATLDAHGAVSELVAAQMATGALQHSKADIAVAITGIAGPGGSQHKPEGRVCFGLATSDNTTSETVEFGAIGRDKVRLAARDHALALLKRAVDSIRPNT